MTGVRRPGATLRQMVAITLVLVTVAALPALVDWAVGHPVVVWAVAFTLAGTCLAILPAYADSRAMREGTVSRHPAQGGSGPLSDGPTRARTDAQSYPVRGLGVKPAVRAREEAQQGQVPSLPVRIGRRGTGRPPTKGTP